VSPEIQNADLLKAIEMAIPATAIEQAIAKTQSEEERKRSLPAQLVVSLVIAMSLWSKDSMRDVLKNLIDGLSEAWIKVGKYWRVPCKSAITQARQRIGARVMSQLFHQLIRPMATQQTLGAFINGLRIVVIDGTCFDVPDSEENARVFGRPSSRPGTIAAFPKVRLVILDELKIHLLGRKTHVRSQKPREVVQEVYGWLLGHWSVRVLMFQAATSASVPPLRLSFTGTLPHILHLSG
jgi:hypothetical protein